MKICPNCGAAADDGTAFCTSCGAPLPASDNTQQTAQNQAGNQSYSYGQNQGANQYQGTNQYQDANQYQGSNQSYGYSQSAAYNAAGGNFGITPRNIAVCIVLTLVTCGLYGLYWMIKLNDEINILAGEPMATNGGMVLVLTIITCGIYGLYWYYKMGERCDRIKRVSASSPILYLVLGLFGLGLISYCLMQDTINKAV